MGIGHLAMQNASGASNNVAIGNAALANSPGTTTNVAIGYLPMQAASGSSSNIAIGSNVMQYSTTALVMLRLEIRQCEVLVDQSSYNVAFGRGAMAYASFSNNNVAIGNAPMGIRLILIIT